MGLLSLGDVVLQSFEVPSSIGFGGKQRVVVHRLIGGQRVIDAMGRDDAALRWRGVLSGSGASDRARLLDSMRADGRSQYLTWDVFCYAVVISELQLSFRSSWWIPYEITCTVQQDLADSSVVDVANEVATVIDDLGAVAQLLGSSDTLNIQSISSLLSSTSGGQEQALLSTSQLQTSIAQGIGNAEVGLGAGDIGTLVSSAGALAQLCCAQGYLDRSVSNITNAGF